LQAYWLDQGTGGECYSVAAKGLRVVWGDDNRCWEWSPEPGARYVFFRWKLFIGGLYELASQFSHILIILDYGLHEELFVSVPGFQEIFLLENFPRKVDSAYM